MDWTPDLVSINFCKLLLWISSRMVWEAILIKNSKECFISYPNRHHDVGEKKGKKSAAPRFFLPASRCCILISWWNNLSRVWYITWTWQKLYFLTKASLRHVAHKAPTKTIKYEKLWRRGMRLKINELAEMYESSTFDSSQNKLFFRVFELISKLEKYNRTEIQTTIRTLFSPGL